jgi:hypothetical protein
MGLIPSPKSTRCQSFFAIAVVSKVGNSKNTLFWTDSWLLVQRLEQSFPHLFGAVAARARKRTINEALTERRWVSDIRGALIVNVLSYYIHLWEILIDVELQPEVEDTHIRQFSPSGQYSTKSAYEALFTGLFSSNPGKFFMWTVAHRKCWTTDRLARKGLSHPAVCPLCDQVEEFGLQVLAPSLDDVNFDDWWANASGRVSGQVQKGLNFTIILGAWNLWNPRSRCVFDGASPDITNVILTTKEELQQWSIAGLEEFLTSLP